MVIYVQAVCCSTFITVTGLWDEYPGLKSQQGQEILSFPKGPEQCWSLSSLHCKGYIGLFSPGLKSSCEADHPPQSNVKV